MWFEGKGGLGIDLTVFGRSGEPSPWLGFLVLNLNVGKYNSIR